jgi:Xaa-Pro aminopeptidase
MYASHADGLRTALRAHGLAGRQLGFDSLEAERLAKEASPQSALRPAFDLVRHARLVKTPLELELMRTASAATVTAALATARQMRALGSLVAARNHFNAEVSRLGNTPVFMVVDGVIAEDHDEPFVDGTTVLIDCVSHFRGYHSDFGRTVFIGEPRPEMARRVRAMGTAWNDLRSRLRPGMRFSEVRSHGAEILHRIQPGMKVPFNPHCVGLAHSDQPRTGLDGEALDVVLEPGMVISVDCPLMEASASGTAHIEDLTLITSGGSVPLHETGDQTIIG